VGVTVDLAPVQALEAAVHVDGLDVCLDGAVHWPARGGLVVLHDFDEVVPQGDRVRHQFDVGLDRLALLVELFLQDVGRPDEGLVHGVEGVHAPQAVGLRPVRRAFGLAVGRHAVRFGPGADESAPHPLVPGLLFDARFDLGLVLEQLDALVRAL